MSLIRPIPGHGPNAANPFGHLGEKLAGTLVRDAGAPLYARFGEHPAWGTAYPAGKGPHQGTDYPAPKGTTVVASFGGKIVAQVPSSATGGRGRVSLVLARTAFGQIIVCDQHLSAWIGRVGATVKQGDPVGKVGNSGDSQGDHDHQEPRVTNDPNADWHGWQGWTAISTERFLAGGDHAADPRVSPYVPPSPPQEDDMPPVTKNLVGYSGTAKTGWNARPSPDTKSTPRYLKADEPWTLVAQVSGAKATSGGVTTDQWIERLDGTTPEFVHLPGVADVKAPAAADCTAAIASATATLEATISQTSAELDAATAKLAAIKAAGGF